MSTPPDPLAPVPQPVLKAAITQSVVLKVLLAVAIITRYVGWWNPSADDLVILAGALTELVSDAVLVIAWFVHNRTTPTVTANKAIVAALATPVPADPIEEADAEFMKTRMQQRADADAVLRSKASTA